MTAWYFPPSVKEKPVLLYFHGNAGHYGHRLPKVQDYLAAGYGVLLAEYRGYGGNPGTLGERELYRDGRAYMKWLEREKEIAPEQVILYGESIGSGVAVQMATEYSVRGLVLEAPFSSLLDVASKTYFFVPVRFLLKDTYNNIQKIGRIKAPLLIMHGRKDNVVPFWQGRRLFEAAGEPKKFIEIPDGGHNDLYNRGISRYVLEFLGGLDGGDRDRLNPY